ncbi:MAG: hypothetical protein WDM86_21310 [Rhizomicrobium sp.]
MSSGLHPLADQFVLTRLEPPAERAARETQARERLVLSIGLATLPLIGLVAGVVGVALLTV